MENEENEHDQKENRKKVNFCYKSTSYLKLEFSLVRSPVGTSRPS